MTFTAIVVSHANPGGLRYMLGNLRYQTTPPNEIIVFCSDTPDVARLREDFPDVEFLERPNREDWGHEKRAEGVERATSEWLGFFNDDDSYDLDYVESMLEAAHGDAVFCGWNTVERPRFESGSSTAGNFIVRRELAQAVGYPSRRYQADGDFIDSLNRAGARVGRVDRVLYRHNVQ